MRALLQGKVEGKLIDSLIDNAAETRKLIRSLDQHRLAIEANLKANISGYNAENSAYLAENKDDRALINILQSKYASGILANTNSQEYTMALEKASSKLSGGDSDFAEEYLNKVLGQKNVKIRENGGWHTIWDPFGGKGTTVTGEDYQIYNMSGKNVTIRKKTATGEWGEAQELSQAEMAKAIAERDLS
jgi:hypothetical protein